MVTIFWLLTLAAAAGAEPDLDTSRVARARSLAAPPPGHVSVSVREVFAVVRDGKRQHILYLSSDDGTSQLPIVVSRTQAFSVATTLEGKPFVRPLTHDLFQTFMLATDTRIREVRIDVLQSLSDEDGSGTYFATLVVVRADGSEVELDARPSDALALAVRGETPVYVSIKLLEESELKEPEKQKREDGPTTSPGGRSMLIDRRDRLQ